MHISGMALQGLRVAIPTAIVALISSEELTRLLDMIPAEVTTGLRIAGGMITVVGFAMVINMMRSKALMPFFFLGFIAAAAIPATSRFRLLAPRARRTSSQPCPVRHSSTWLLSVLWAPAWVCCTPS